MATFEIHKEDYFISTDITKLDINIIYDYLCNESYWAAGIPKQTVEKAIANSLCFGLYYKNDQIGFARLVTDKATFAYLADVFVLPAHRGKGLSKWLMQNIHAHPEVQDLRRWMLGTRDAHKLYELFGWKSLDEAATKRFMQIHNPDVYKKS